MSLLLLAGCAAQNWQKTIPPANPAYSQALNMFIASGEIDGPTRYVKDLPPEQLEKLGVNLAPGGSNLAVSTGYAATHAINPPINVSTGTAAAMSMGFLVFGLLESAVYKPGAWDTTWAWVPITFGKDPVSAISESLDQVEQAWLKTIGTGYRATNITISKEKRADVNRKFQLEGPGCSPTECILFVTAQPSEISSLQMLKTQPSPQFLPSIGIVYSPIKVGASVKPGSPVSWDKLTFAQYRSFSAALPEWAVIYLAPKKGRNAVPVMLHKGAVLYFVQPGTAKAG